VRILNDRLNEADETVNLSLSNPTNAAIAAPSATLTIVDDDPPPQVRFESTLLRVGEDRGSIDITVILDRPSGQTVTVDYATSDGTATAGQDYDATNGTLTFQPGETIKHFTVKITFDSVGEQDETVGLTLSNANNASVAEGQATLTITDYLILK